MGREGGRWEEGGRRGEEREYEEEGGGLDLSRTCMCKKEREGGRRVGM